MEQTALNPASENAAASASPLMTAKDLAQMLQLSTRTLWRLLSAGRLPPPVRIGGAVRWRHEIIVKWIGEGCPLTAEWQNLHRT